MRIPPEPNAHSDTTNSSSVKSITKRRSTGPDFEHLADKHNLSHQKQKPFPHSVFFFAKKMNPGPPHPVTTYKSKTAQKTGRTKLEKKLSLFLNSQPTRFVVLKQRQTNEPSALIKDLRPMNAITNNATQQEQRQNLRALCLVVREQLLVVRRPVMRRNPMRVLLLENAQSKGSGG